MLWPGASSRIGLRKRRSLDAASIMAIIETNSAMRNVLSYAALIALVGCGVALIGVISIGALNSDLYGKLTETRRVRDVGRDSPSLMLVLHRVLSDENAVEASMVLELSDQESLNALRQGKLELTGIARDATAVLPFGLRNEVILDRKASVTGGR